MYVIRQDPIESFSEAERRVLEPYFTNLDGPVFALVNLPEVVKGALFARYSRSAKSLRRLFLDEFAEEAATGGAGASVGVQRAEKLYERVFLEYGDDSVAQLGGVHLACENVSNVLTKVLEWGRLMAYLEQSTRYVPYTDRPGGRYKYHVPAELRRDAELRGAIRRARSIEAFDTYTRWLEPMQEHFTERKHPKSRRRFGGSLPADDPGQGARHAARSAARRDAGQRGHLRDRSGLRGTVAATACASAARGA